MLDHFLPEPRLIEIDHADIGAPPERVYEVLRHLDATRSALVRTLFSLRTLPDRLAGRATETPHVSIDEIGRRAEPGFRILAEEPGRSITVGAIGKVWEAEIPFADVTPDTFAAFAEPGYARVAWEVRCEPRGAGTRVVLELRVGATDDEAWAKTRRYFRLIGPFSHWIRRHFLAMVVDELGTAEEQDSTRPLPGDALLPDAKAVLTLSIPIQATPEAIWPFLVQMGARRAGWYSYDRLDNGGRESAWEVVPELQDLSVGQIIAATPEGEDGYEVLAIERDRALVLGGLYDTEQAKQLAFSGSRPEVYWQVTWAFVLEPLNERETKLLVRARADFAPASMKWKAAWIAPVHHFMEMEQLRNIQARAEHRPHTRASDVGEGIVGAMGMLFNFATPFLRGKRSHWGIDEATAQRDYPGDELVPDPSWSWTHGVEIDAPMERVWPWITQIGQSKGGFYSYQWLENIGGCEIQNADRPHEEWSHPRVGDALKIHPTAPGFVVAAVREGEWLVTRGEEPADRSKVLDPEAAVSWLFFLEPLPGGRTRFVSRYRVRHGDGWKSKLAYGPLFIEPVGFMMDRRMLLGVKERVEEAERAA
jgi:hypothetical protein